MLATTTDNQVQLDAYHQSIRDARLSIRCLVAAFRYLGIPESLYDVGCGPGHLVSFSRGIGINAVGVDANLQPITGHQHVDYLHRVDLTEHQPVHPADMVICWELAEHLHITASDKLVTMLANSTKQHLLFSAATPGQGGSGHINEQPHGYWMSKICKQGLVFDMSATDVLRERFTSVAPAAWWYGKNLLVFNRA